MIEFSTQTVSADSRETLLALLVLFCFALVAATYVYKKGIEKGDRTRHEILLKCVIIVTSVVPRQLPVQMAMAVNTALMALMKNGILCTEPYRVPHAGKITHCLFDKTGTLTTDQVSLVRRRGRPSFCLVARARSRSLGESAYRRDIIATRGLRRRHRCRLWRRSVLLAVGGERASDGPTQRRRAA